MIKHFLGWLWVLYSIPGLIVVLYIISVVTKFLEKRQINKMAKASCQHGMEGAVQTPQLCSACMREREEREAAAKAEREARIQKEHAEKQRKHQEWVRQIRLPEYLKTVDPREFEHIICELYRRLGYTAKVTSYVGDGGIDGYLEKDGEKAILQCKRVKGSVGEPILRDLYGAMHASRANSAIVVTTGRVSKQARLWASDKPICIIELQELRSLINANFKEDEVIPSSFTVEKTEHGLCPKCGSEMHIVKGRNNTFLGCSNYPHCRHTRPFRQSKYLLH